MKGKKRSTRGTRKSYRPLCRGCFDRFPAEQLLNGRCPGCRREVKYTDVRRSSRS